MTETEIAMTSTELSFVHHFEAATRPAAPAVLLLHGTGGDETDLLPLGRAVAPGAALLSPRGKVLENGMPRFFRRLAEGVFDEADLRHRADELARFVTEARETYGLPAPIAIGFSNGANIAAALLLLHPGVLAGAALLRAMVPLRDPPPALRVRVSSPARAWPRRTSWPPAVMGTRTRPEVRRALSAPPAMRW